VVCVYNDPAVRERCLDASIRALSDEADDVEYLPIDNVGGAFASAGAALNHGTALAAGDVVVFVHQDVWLHSLTALKAAAGELLRSDYGLLGAVGITLSDRMVGRIRDRVILTADAVTQLAEVDTVDEVLFMASRSQLASHPLTEAADLAWHAYAVEYGLRLRRLGLRTGVADIPLTHNSLSTNVERLDVAHRAIAEAYADLLPVQTTCGLITSKRVEPARTPPLQPFRWRYRWLRESIELRGARRPASPAVMVLADIRHDIDDLVSCAPGHHLSIVNRSSGADFADGSVGRLELPRFGGVVSLAASSLSRLPALIRDQAPGSWLLVTNLSRTDIAELSQSLAGRPSVLGFHSSTGYWLLLGASAAELPLKWRSKSAIPLGARARLAEPVA
jgi:hypothetical protein